MRVAKEVLGVRMAKYGEAGGLSTCRTASKGGVVLLSVFSFGTVYNRSTSKILKSEEHTGDKHVMVWILYDHTYVPRYVHSVAPFQKSIMSFYT